MWGHRLHITIHIQIKVRCAIANSIRQGVLLNAPCLRLIDSSLLTCNNHSATGQNQEIKKSA